MRIFERPGASNTTKIQRKDFQEREERMKIVAGREKKAQNFGRSGGGRVRRRGPAEGGPGKRAGGAHKSWTKTHSRHTQGGPAEPRSRRGLSGGKWGERTKHNTQQQHTTAHNSTQQHTTTQQNNTTQQQQHDTTHNTPPQQHTPHTDVVFFVQSSVFLFCPNVVFFVPRVCFVCPVRPFLICPECLFFCPDNRLLILSRFCFFFFCPIAFFFVQLPLFLLFFVPGCCCLLLLLFFLVCCSLLFLLWCLLVVPVGGACWWCLLVVPVGGASVGGACWWCLCWWCLLVVPVGGACWWCLLVVLVGVCVVGVFKIFGPLSRTALLLDRPKFRSFCSLSRHNFHSFISLWEVFSLNCGVVFEGRDPQMCTFGLSGCLPLL